MHYKQDTTRVRNSIRAIDITERIFMKNLANCAFSS